MVAVATTSRLTSQQALAVYHELYTRGALTPSQVASLVGSERDATEDWLKEQASRHLIQFDPRFGRYGID